MVRIHLSDGSFFVIAAETFAGEGIETGVLIDRARIAALQERSQIVLAREAAFRLLSRAGQTRRGLARKLRSRGFSPETARAAVSRMVELGYVDDRAFAESWTRFRISTRRDGWKSLYRGLVKNGVPRKIAEEVLASACTEDVELERARLVVRGLSPRTAVGRLTARGFRSRTIARILSEMKREAPQESEE